MRPIGRVLLLGIVVAGWAAFAQTNSHAEMPKGDAVMVTLFNPNYPPLASLANITGDVGLKLGVGNDGSIESAVVVSGHPMLRDAALDSARKSRFECPGCREPVTSYSLTYSFRLVASPDFPCAESHVHVTRSQNRITVTGKPRVVHPYFASVSNSLREMPISMEMRFPLGRGGLLFLSRSFGKVSGLVELRPPPA